VVDGGHSSPSGSPTSCSHPFNSFGGILAGRADYYYNFNHRSFGSMWVPQLTTLPQEATPTTKAVH